jgi:putative FmdB family regulatory protein
MPNYEYRCKRCFEVFDKNTTVDNRYQSNCPRCSGEGQLKINKNPVHYKAKGFTGAQKSDR